MFKSKTLDNCKPACHTGRFMCSFWMHENLYSFCAESIKDINDSISDVFARHPSVQLDTLPITVNNPKVHVTMKQTDEGSVSFYMRLYWWNPLDKMYEECGSPQSRSVIDILRRLETLLVNSDNYKEYSKLATLVRSMPITEEEVLKYGTDKEFFYVIRSLRGWDDK